MALVSVGLGGTQTITQSESDTVNFLGLGTLNVTGAPGAPINVTLSQVGGIGLLDVINITNANVTLGGVAGVSALVSYRIGSGGQLTMASTVGVTVGSNVVFTAPNSRLVLGPAVDLSLLSGISGFGQGSSIDVGQLATSVVYADAPGANTGGTLTLFNGGLPVGSLSLLTGDFTTADFRLGPDGSGGTIIGFTGVNSVVASPPNGDLGLNQVVTLTVATSGPVTVTGGPPTLVLNDGGVATYNPAASTGTSLVFGYTVAAGQNTADLAVTGTALNGATITDTAGNALNLLPVVVNPAGTLQIDTTAPLVTGVTSTPDGSTLAIGQLVTLKLATSEPVSVVGGVPTLTLHNGGTATFNPAASTPTSLAFTYAIAAGQNANDLAVTATSLNGATVADPAANAINLSGAIGLPVTGAANYAVTDTTTHVSYTTPGDPYTGPVAGLQHQYINITTDDLVISALVPNSFIHSGSGTDAIDVSRVNGNNVLDGSTGSNFLIGGTGTDTFFIDDRAATADIWSTIVNFHAGDATTFYGLTNTGFTLDWEDGQGTAGYTGLTLHATALGKPEASMTLVGFTKADLGNGKLSVQFGNDPSTSSNYLYVQAN